MGPMPDRLPNDAQTDITVSEIKGMIRLLDDDDPEVASAIAERLLVLGQTALPTMEQELRHASEVAAQRMRVILELAGLTGLAAEFRRWAGQRDDPEYDSPLEEGALLVAATALNDLDRGSVKRRLAELAEMARGHMHPAMTPEERVEALCHTLFVDNGLVGNREDYYAPENIYIDAVLKRKTGIPITLSTVAILVGNRLGLPIVGVGMRVHFLCAYRTQDVNILFDPYENGRIVTPADCQTMLDRMGLKLGAEDMVTVSATDMVARMLRNLVMIFQHQKRVDCAVPLARYLRIVSGVDLD